MISLPVWLSGPMSLLWYYVTSCLATWCPVPLGEGSASKGGSTSEGVIFWTRSDLLVLAFWLKMAFWLKVVFCYGPSPILTSSGGH